MLDGKGTSVDTCLYFARERCAPKTKLTKIYSS